MSRASSSFSPIRKAVIAGAVVAAVFAGWHFLGKKSTEALPPPPNPWMGPVPVRTTPAITEDLKVHIKAIGTVTPLNSVTLKSRVEGPLIALWVEEGQSVKAGDLIAEIDPAPYKVRLAQAEGTLQQTRAQLTNAKEDLVMHQRLYKQNSVAKQQLDKQIALADQLEGTLKNHQAAVDDARLQLSYTRITAPISGRLGLRRADVGNLISANDANGLFTITQTQPISVLFTIPETQLTAVRKAYRDAQATKQMLATEAWDRSEKELLAIGQLTTLDNQIETATGTLKLKAQFENTDNSLFPNQFVNTKLHLTTLTQTITIAADAVQYGSKGTYVYTVSDNKAHMKLITLGAQEGNRIAVLEGLQEGDLIVLEGIDRLTDGRAINLMDRAE